MKSFIFVALVILIVYSIHTFGVKDQSKDTEGNDNKTTIEDIQTANNLAGLNLTEHNNISNAYFDKNLVQSYVRCKNKISPKMISSAVDKMLSDLSEEQLERLNEVYDRNIEFCEEFENYLSSVNTEVIAGIEKKYDSHSEELSFFLALTKESKVEVSRDVLFGHSEQVSHNLALNHLLRNDTEFIKLLAKEVGTENLNLIRNNRREIFTIYKCQNGSSQCDSQSSLMSARCIFNSDYCGLDYVSYLEKTRTLNEVNDIFNLANALRIILSKNI